MTKEVAQKIVRGIKNKIECNTADIDDWAEFWGFTIEEYKEFLDMAIEALESEPCDDAISRQDLRESRFIIAENDYQKGWNDALDSVYENAPSIQPQSKMGHWEQYGDFWEDKCRCSECGEKQPKILCGERIVEYWSDFCPHCGADMRGEHDE